MELDEQGLLMELDEQGLLMELDEQGLLMELDEQGLLMELDEQGVLMELDEQGLLNPNGFSIFDFREGRVLGCDTQIVCVDETPCSIMDGLIVCVDVEKDRGEKTTLG